LGKWFGGRVVLAILRYAVVRGGIVGESCLRKYGICCLTNYNVGLGFFREYGIMIALTNYSGIGGDRIARFLRIYSICCLTIYDVGFGFFRKYGITIALTNYSGIGGDRKCM